jgi:hypothetical protein
VISVSIDGTRYLYHKETDGFNQGLGVASRVVSTTGSAFVNVFIESDNENNSKFKNLRIVNGRFISDKTSNIAFIGGNLGVGVNSPKESLDILGNMHLTRVSNVSQIKVDSNVVTEYTGPHDRPLRKYPEVAFPLSTSSESAASGATTFTYKGYTVTSNSVYSGTAYKISNAFDGTATSWSGNLGDYDSNGDVASGRTANYLQIQLPNAIKLENIKITSEANYEYANGPRNITLYGSNNGSNWVTLKTETDLPLDGGTTNPDPQTAFVHVNTTTKYLYYKLEISKIYISSGGATYARIGEWELYGHEEGSASLDTTLKTVYNVPATTGTQLEVYYDAKDLTTMPSTVTDLSPNTNTGAVSGHSPTLDSTDGIDSFKFNGSSQYVTGAHGLTTGSDPVHTISLWLNAVELTDLDYVVQLGQGGTSHQQSAIIFKDNKIGHAHWGSGVLSEVTIANNVWYHVVAVFTGGNGSDLSKHKIFINGEDGGVGAFPGSTDGPVVLTGTQLTLGRNNNQGGTPGDYFNGSIANFRLYSKALNADQVKELYDYQKDYFLGSKSQVTLYKGHLGVGVTEPSGQLELAGDERIQEYPPRGMTNTSTYIEGHGVFKAYGFQPHASYPAWKAFDDTATNSVWYSDGLSEYSGTGDYSGSTRLAPETVKGAYIVLEMPYEIVLKQIKFWQQINGSHVWDRGVYYAKCNPTDEWTAIHNVTDRPADDDTPYVAYITDPRPYKYFAIVITRRHTADATNGVSIRDLQFFGTPGPTTLDKGSLTLGRSLDVPRVSRYDVDTETPRPEKLVVDFDTTVNSSPTDISGQGNHGRFVDGSGVKGTTPWDGKISNFKLYSVALEPSEVKKLYNLGQTGRSMVISDTAVGIGKVPEAQLDVRGNLKVSGVISSNSPGWSYWRYVSADINTAVYNSATDGPVGGFSTLSGFGQNWETGISGQISDRGTSYNFNPTTGVYTVPEKGVYMVNFNFSIEGGSGGDDSMYAQFTVTGNADGGGWETGGAFINRSTSTNAFMLLNAEFSTRSGIETCYAINDILLLDAGSTVNVRFENVSSASTMTLLRCNFSGFKIA